MARKKKKRSKKSRLPEKELTVAQLEEQVARSFENGNLRQAVSGAQRLCKRDQEHYEPLLRRARIALVEALLAKGRLSQARAAFELLQKMSPGPEIDDLTLRLARESGDFSVAAPIAARLLITDHQGDANDGEKRRAADVLVLSFADFPSSLAADHPGPAAELRQVHRALELVCEQSYDEALAAVSGLGRRSPFAPWRLFIKGLVAFYRGEDDKARQAFARLPADSWLSAAAAPFQLLLLPLDDHGCRQLAKDESQLRDACLLAGRADLAAFLPRVNYLWMTGRHRDSFRYLRRHLPDFPRESPDACGSLTRFYYNAVFSLPDEVGMRYVDFLMGEATKDRGQNPTLILRGIRVTALCAYSHDIDDEVVTLWQDFVLAYRHFYGENKVLESLIHARLGEYFAQEIEIGRGMNPFQLPEYFDNRAGKKEYYDEEEAEKYFRLSLEADDGNKQAWIALLNLYDGAGWKSKRNRLLDDIVKRFPDDKDALLKAGAGCWERQAMHKGWKYFRRALDLNPLDREVQEKFILGTISLALEQVLKGRWERCRSLLDEVVDITRPELDDVNCGRSYVLGRWSVFSLLADKDQEALEFYEQALEQAPNPDVFLYFYWLYALSRGIKPSSLARLKKPLKKLMSTASITTALACLEIFSYCCRLLDEEDIDVLLGDEEKRLQQQLAKAVRQADNRQAARVMEYALEDIVTSRRLIRACLRRLKAIDRRSPYYLFYDYVARHMQKVIFPRPGDEEFMRNVLSRAEETGDQLLISKISSQLSRIEIIVNMCEAIQDHVVEELEDEDYLDMPLSPPGAEQVPPSWKESPDALFPSKPPGEKAEKKEVPPGPSEFSEDSSLFDLLDD